MTKIDYLLVCLMEEAAEIQQAASKAIRFGFDEYYLGPPNNREQLQKEICDLSGVVKMLIDEGALDVWPDDKINAAVDAKIAKVKKYMEYSRKCGVLEDEVLKDEVLEDETVPTPAICQGDSTTKVIDDIVCLLGSICRNKEIWYRQANGTWYSRISRLYLDIDGLLREIYTELCQVDRVEHWCSW